MLAQRDEGENPEKICSFQGWYAYNFSPYDLDSFWLDSGPELKTFLGLRKSGFNDVSFGPDFLAYHIKDMAIRASDNLRQLMDSGYFFQGKATTDPEVTQVF